MPSDVFTEMLTQLKIANRLLAVQLRRNMGQKELIDLLATIASAKEIAEVLDTTPATVVATRARLKKESADPQEKSKKQRQLPGPKVGH